MYINFWYPICSAAELEKTNPLRVIIMGMRLVAFRDDSGQASVLADTCVHRGGSLSKGKIVDSRIACPYHGWQFDGQGRCQHVPSLEGRGKIPARAKVDAYPVRELYGIVFAFLGDLPEAERPELFEIAEWGQPEWRASSLNIIELDAYFERSIENGLDPVHNEFVHAMQGNVKFKPECMWVDEDDWGTKVTVRMDPPKKGATTLEHLRNDDDPDHFGAFSYHYGPNALVTRIQLSAANIFVQYFWEQPVDENHTRIFFINMRNCMLDDSNDEKINQINMAVAGEDVVIISELYPVRTPESSTKEILISGDECIGAFRRHLQKWQDQGWRIDWKTVRANAGDVAYAIPSPGRKTEKNWVLDAVPLFPGAGK